LDASFNLIGAGGSSSLSGSSSSEISISSLPSSSEAGLEACYDNNVNGIEECTRLMLAFSDAFFVGLSLAGAFLLVVFDLAGSSSSSTA
jgi:hypothetical protein